MLRVLLIYAILYFHPVHVTLITINQADGSDTLNMFFRMYYDDFLRDYKLFDPEFEAVKDSDTTGINRGMIDKYFSNRVQVYINHKLMAGTITTVSIDSYEIRLDLIYSSEKKPRIFAIRNKILTTLYSDQANMVYLKINNYEDAIKLTVDDIEEERKLK